MSVLAPVDLVFDFGLLYTYSMSDSNEIRKNVLRGGFVKNLIVWEPFNGKLRVFFSSTFTDTHRERNRIQQKILKDLQPIARSKKIPVTLVDMRYGVKDENTLAHQTWIACSNEIERCRLESSGIFFVCLQGNK